MAIALLGTPAAFDNTFDDPDTAATNSYTVATGSDRFMIVSVSWVDAASHIMLASDPVTYNDVAMTEFAAVSDNLNCKKHSFYLKNPDEGAHDLVVRTQGGIGNAAASIDVIVYSGVDQTDSFDWMTPTTGQDTSPGTDDATNAEITINSAAGCKVVALFAGEFSATATAAALTGVTEQLENHNSTISSAVGDADGDTSVVASAVWTVGFGNVDWIAQGISLNAAAGGGGGSAPMFRGS